MNIYCWHCRSAKYVTCVGKKLLLMIRLILQILLIYLYNLDDLYFAAAIFDCNFPFRKCPRKYIKILQK